MKKSQSTFTEVDAHGVELEGKLDTIVEKITIRSDGSRRIQQDFSLCPTRAEQHTAHLSDINYLIKKYKPDELAQYLAARTAHRQEILGHDFSVEPNMQEAKNVIYKSKQEFEKLPDDVRVHFSSHLEFLKFIDNPANVDKMLKMGILTKTQINNITIPDAPSPTPTPTPPLEKQTPNPNPK